MILAYVPRNDGLGLLIIVGFLLWGLYYAVGFLLFGLFHVLYTVLNALGIVDTPEQRAAKRAEQALRETKRRNEEAELGARKEKKFTFQPGDSIITSEWIEQASHWLVAHKNKEGVTAERTFASYEEARCWTMDIGRIEFQKYLIEKELKEVIAEEERAIDKIIEKGIDWRARQLKARRLRERGGRE